MLRRSLLIGAALVAALGLVSCGDEAESPSASSDDTTAVTAAQTIFAGTVTDDAGAPVNHAALEIISKDGHPVPELAVVTGADGKYDGPPLPAGDYTINVTAEGYQKATKDATLGESGPTTVDFVLTKA